MIKRFLTSATACLMLVAASMVGSAATAASAGATTCPTGSWNAETLGAPTTLHAGMEGMALYRNHDNGVFSLRMSTKHRVDLYWGSITSDGVLFYRAARTERGDYIRQVSPHKVVFAMSNFGHIDGLDFVPACGSKVTLHLGVFRHSLPTADIYLGAGATHPAANPFTEVKA